jgi:uncharacterized protein YqeY
MKMGKLQEKIYKNIQDTNRSLRERSILKLIKGDIQKERTKEVSDNIVLKVIKSYISGAEEMLVYLDKNYDHDKYQDEEYTINVLSMYLPKMVSNQEIKDFINTLDMSQFKNKMQAMKPIMKHFGSSADGNSVKSILMDM